MTNMLKCTGSLADNAYNPQEQLCTGFTSATATGWGVVLASLYVQGVPKKTPVSVQMLLKALKNELQIKVG